MNAVLGRHRTLLLAAALLAVPVLGGCSAGHEKDRARVDAAAQRATETIDGVLHEIADEVQITFNEGNYFDALCGDDLAPTGVVHTVILNFTNQTSDLLDAEMIDRTESLLAGDGWEVERPAAPTILLGTKDRNNIRFEFGNYVVVQIESDCVETSNKVAREYADGAGGDVTWK